MIPDIFRHLEELYTQLPEISCTCCGECCVSPTCTLVEFAYLMHHAIRALPPDRVFELLASPPRFNPEHDGNLYCAFIEKGLCSVHPVRTGSCRLFGIPAMEEFGIADLTVCKHQVTVASGRAEAEFLTGWIEQLFHLNRRIYDPDAHPYFLRGLNIPTWLDIYFDSTLDYDIFREIRTFMRQALDLSSYAAQYRFHTGIKEKIDKISLLSALVDTGDVATMRRIAVSLRDDYPLTGTYYLAEAESYLQVLEGRNG